MRSNPGLTIMLPGISSGLGSLIFMLGETPVPANAGARPCISLSLTCLKSMMTVPNGEPPSSLCSWPVSSTTTMLWNCISSFGIINAFLISIGCCSANCGCANSCACITGNIAEFVDSKLNLTLPSTFSPTNLYEPPSFRFTHGTAPNPLALAAGIVRLPPSMRFQTTCSAEKLRAALRFW